MTNPLTHDMGASYYSYSPATTVLFYLLSSSSDSGLSALSIPNATIQTLLLLHRDATSIAISSTRETELVFVRQTQTKQSSTSPREKHTQRRWHPIMQRRQAVQRPAGSNEYMTPNPTTSPTSFRSLLTPSSPVGFSPLRHLQSSLINHLSTSSPSTM